MSNAVYKIFLEKLGDSDATTFIGEVGDIFYDPTTSLIRRSDGSTPGGIVITGAGSTGAMNDLIDDLSPSLGGNLDLNSKSITGTGTISITGSVTATAGFTGDLTGTSTSSTQVSTSNTTGTSDHYLTFVDSHNASPDIEHLHTKPAIKVVPSTGRLTATILNAPTFQIGGLPITASLDEINLLDGVTATTVELNYVDGVTSSIQTQLDNKQSLDGDLTNLSNCQSGASAAISQLTQTEVEILDGCTRTTAQLNRVDATSSIQTQIDGKQPLDADLTSLAGCQSGAAGAIALLTQTEVEILDGATVTTAQLNRVDATSSIQTQIDTKSPIASPTFTGTPAAPTAAQATNTTQVATTAFVQSNLTASLLRSALGITEASADPADGRGVYFDTTASKYLVST